MSPSDDMYGRDVLAQPRATRSAVPEVVGARDLVIECADSGWCGALTGWTKTSEGWAVTLEDRHGATRVFPAHPAAFLLEGQPVTLVRPVANAGTAAPRRTASGSVAVPDRRARVARASRILVEGRHDAELVEKVWGDDLRIEGVVVEMLDGLDNLLEVLAERDLAPGRRIGVLADHLVTGTKETRIAAEATARYGDAVLVVGHPFVDIWQAIKPSVAGISSWPEVPRGQDWKAGACASLGWGDDTGAAWRRLRNAVSGWTDLEPTLLAPVEELIDFVTADAE